MATRIVPLVPMGEGGPPGDAALQRPWRKAIALSSLADRAEGFLEGSGFDRAPWIAIGLAAGIAAWFVLPGPTAWLAFGAAGFLAAIASAALWRGVEERGHLRRGVVCTGMLLACGLLLVWARSETVGGVPLDGPRVTWLDGRILDREEQPAEGRVRLTLAYRDAEAGIARKVRINVAPEQVAADAVEGATVRLRARLMPPGSPMVPGAYDFARTAWFSGLAATGSAMGPVTVTSPAPPGGGLASLQRSLSAHVRSQLAGSPGAIAAAFASGDRGGIAEADEQAMRDAGLTHLLSISGVHVSALIAAVYFVVIRLLALWPWLVLRVRLPLVAAAVAAGAGVGYTLLTGAEVPTVRSCIGALLVLGALALGREPLSLRMVAAAAVAVLLMVPEALVGPSFQMSFAAVIAIVALHEAEPVKRFLAPREESLLMRWGRRVAMLLIAGVVIEIALTPIVLFHFHRAGFYGAFANVVAIPLVTFISMPLIALALVLDVVGAGAPAWWLAGQSLELLLSLARATAAQPGAVRLMPQMGGGTFALFIAGSLWLGLWHGRRRLLGLIPIALATGMLWATPTPDVLVSGDGRHVGLVEPGTSLLVLREGRSEFARDNLLELAGLEGEPVPLDGWPGATCSREFCAITLGRAERKWRLLLARNRAPIEERALAAACERADIVVAERFLPFSCRPAWLKADRRYLEQAGGLAIYLDSERVVTVAESQGEHPWWTARGR